MYPYLNIGPLHLGMFGLLLWLAAVVGTIVLHHNFVRNSIDADALNVVALVVIAGVVGAKAWHEFEDVAELRYAMRVVGAPGWHHAGDVVLRFLTWFRDGFAWYGGMLAGIAMLMWQGTAARFKGPLQGTLGKPVGAIRMLDLAAPAAAVGYGVGRIGCLLAGDGDYGINTTLPWGVRMAKNALVPPSPPNALVQPTPIYELLFSLVLGWILWQLGKKAWPVGWMTSVYLVLSGVGRFLVEFVRINPKLYFNHTLTNAQMAALGSVLVGLLGVALASVKRVGWTPELKGDPAT
jgi:phosphatidylglycerol---prolipoprotein diacylglyceryl transferase